MSAIFFQFTAQIPSRPEFPDGTDIRSCIALGSRTKPTIQWLVFRNEPTMMDWLRSISDTVTLTHGLRTPNEGMNQRNLKLWANVVDKICFGSTYKFGIGI